MKAQEKFDKVMHEWKSGSLKSSSGEKVKYPKDHTRAVAIALSEARGIDPNFQKKNKGGMMETEEMSEKEKLEKTIVYDNGGETLDRYTVFTPDGFVFGMSETASGFNQFLGDETEIQKGKHLGKKLNKVPKEIEWAVLDRMKEEYKKGGSMAKGGGVNKFKIGERMEVYPHSQSKGEFTVTGYDDLGGGKFQYIGKFENDNTEYRFLPNPKDKAYPFGGSMAKGGEYRGYDNGGILDEKRSLQERIDKIRKGIESYPDPENRIRRGMEMKLADLERKLAEYTTPEPIEERVIEQAPTVEEVKEQIQPETPIEKEGEEDESEAIETETEAEAPTEKTEERKIKTKIEGTIKGEFEGTITTDGKSAKVVGKVRNVTVPDEKRYWIDIEKKFIGPVRNALYFHKPERIYYKRRTIKNKYRIFVDTAELQKRVFDIYNEKREKESAAPITDISSITGKFKRGGKLMMAKKPQIDLVLREKAKKMGLVKGDEQISDKDLKKISKLSPRWRKRVQLARSLDRV